MNWWPTKGGCRLIKGTFTERVTEWTTISGAAECYDVDNINTDLQIIYDNTCPGLNCFETYPCRYEDNACNVNTVLDATGDAEVQWAGQCKTLAECQAACSSWGCSAMNWWPTKGGCRLIKGTFTERV